jgi:WD40 repeat protein
MEPLAAGDPQRVGVYLLHSRLGAGGMGRVFLGFSPAKRAVAVKVIHQEFARDPEFVRRFRREVQAAKSVSGAYTAPVVAAGPDDDPPWLATAFVAGPSLAEAVAQAGPLPEAAIWRLAGGLVEALQAVHACGLVHRDLKPTNVLLAADGPRVIDFGISRALEGSALTGTSMMMGTPAFMSPEQAEGLPVDAASDVFALGSVIAFAATGTAPFGSGAPLALVYRVVHAQPDLSGVPVALRDMVCGCLAKTPAARPPLSRLIGAIMAGSASYPGTSPVDFWPDPLAGLVSSRQDSFRAQVLPSEELGSVAATPSLSHKPTALDAGQHGGETTRTAHPAWRIAPTPQDPPSRLVGTLTAHGASYAVAFSPEGSTLATCGSAGVWLWDPATGQHLRTLGDGASSVAFSPAGLLASNGNRTVQLWDPVNGESLHTLRCDATAMAFSPDGRLLAIVGNKLQLSRGPGGIDVYKATVQLWDAVAGRHVRELAHDELESSYSYVPRRGPPDVHGLAFSPDGGILATGSSDSTIRLWNPATGQHLRTIKGQKEAVSCVAFSPDGRILATGGSDSTVRLWNPADGQHLRTIKGRTTLRTYHGRISIRRTLARRKADSRAMAFSPDGHVLATIADETAHLWDPATGQHVRTLTHKDFVMCVAFSPDGRMLATGGSESIVRLWG